MEAKTKTNSEGLTFDEWFAAANAFDRHTITRGDARKAWLRGDDPTEYAARGPLKAGQHWA